MTIQTTADRAVDARRGAARMRRGAYARMTRDTDPSLSAALARFVPGMRCPHDWWVQSDGRLRTCNACGTPDWSPG